MDITTIINSKSKTFLAFCFCFLAGIAVGSLCNMRLPAWFMLAIGLSLIGNIAVFWRSRIVRFVLVCLVFIASGVFRYAYAIPDSAGDTISRHYGETVSFTGMIASEPDVRQDGVRYIVEVDRERVYVKSNLYPRYGYGDMIDIECTLARPEPFDNFRYDMYLARYGVFALCERPTITPVGTNEGHRFRVAILGFRDLVAVRINELWHEPYASFMAGLLYGYRGGLGDLSDRFARTGVSHIVAVSGYNISIVANMFLLLLITVLWIPRKQAFWLVLAGIVAYVIFTGASASVVRAGVMGILVLLGQYLGRPRTMINVLMVTAVVMNLVNPFVLMWDAGFQLSFLATAGLLFLSSLAEERLGALPERFAIRKNAATTLSAIMVTLPLMLFQFGQLSIVAPIVNVLVLGMLPPIMALGFLSICLSLVLPTVASLVAAAAFVLMKYITTIVTLFSSLPFASATIYLPWWGMVIMYGTLGWWYKRKLYKKQPTI